MSDKMNYCIDCVSYFLDKEKNRYFCADKKTRIEDVPCEFFEQRCDDDIDNPWHTGTPTEEGNYLLRLRHANMKFDTANFRNGKFMSYHNHRHDPEDIIKWQKIEPYEDDA